MLILIFHDVILSFSCSWYMHGFCLKRNKDIIIIIIIIIKFLITSYLANRMSRKIITMKKNCSKGFTFRKTAVYGRVSLE